MIITSIASGSRGNCYHLRHGNTSLLIEAGVSPKSVNNRGIKLSDCSGLLISHEHYDHSKYASIISNQYDVTVYASKGTFDVIDGVNNNIPNKVVIKRFEAFSIGCFSILPFDVDHDANEPLGFVITTTDTFERLVFFTDTCRMRYLFSHVKYLMAECNYVNEILSNAVAIGSIGKRAASRIRYSHMGLDELVDFIGELDKSELSIIYALHLSDRHSDEGLIKRTLQAAAGCAVYVC